MPQLMKSPRARAGAVVGALSVALVTGLAATPASANSSGWWTSPEGRAEGFYNSLNGRVYANDLRKDGYSAITQVRTARNGYFVVDVRDKLANGQGSWKTPTLYAGVRFKMRVCVYKTGHKPVKCGSWHEFDK
ncbi:hypothetical protein ACFXC8_56165 [Streptomyces sp. NPDC059441]|uniref:hypothetical protein n=1 Tax=Streptomyces sp. NPDC059441 TaxID=3346829 RepID=UPI0036B50453